MTIIEKKELIRDFAPVLQRIDDKLMECQFIPMDENSLGNEYVLLRFVDRVRYIKITNKNPFQIVNHIISAMNDYCFTVQYESYKITNLLNKELAIQEEQEKENALFYE